MKKVKIRLKDYDYECGDGCCTWYGTITEVNDIRLPIENTDRYTIIKQILEHLGYEVDIDECSAYDECDD